MRIEWAAAWAVMTASVLVTGAAAADFDAAKAFGERDMVRHASLSPDGKMVGLVQPYGPQGYGLFVAKVDGDTAAKPIVVSSGNPEQLMSCGWVSNTRLICNVRYVLEEGGLRYGATRLVSINADGTKLQVVSGRVRPESYSYAQDGGDIVDWLADDPAAVVLMTRAFAQEYSTGTLLSNAKGEGLGVERVDTDTMRRTLVEQPKADAIGFISDQHGSVRIYVNHPVDSGGQLRRERQYYYRANAKAQWQPLSIYNQEEQTGFIPVAVDRDLNAAYGFEWIDGHRAAVRVSLDGSKKREVILARNDVDIDGLIRIGRQRRVVGVSFATDKRQAVYFDPTLKALASALSKALPGQPDVHFEDASLDESRLLIWAGSDVQPGRYYLYDKAARNLRPLVETRPALSAVKLATMRPVTFKAADGTPIPAYLTLPASGADKNLPAIVMPHGGPEARDEWGFDWLAQFFAARGYAVLQPNFRGSSGYGEAWFQDNGFKSWRTAVGDINDAGRWLQSQGIAAPGKLAIVGWSYGGYAALQSQVLDPELFKAVVAIAPVTDLEALRDQSRQFTNFTIVDNFIGHGPHIKEGSPAQNPERFKAPVLMFHGDIDENVVVGESRLMLGKLKGAGAKADLIVYPGLNHQLDDSKARNDMLARSDAFLRENLGP